MLMPGADAADGAEVGPDSSMVRTPQQRLAPDRSHYVAQPV